MYTRRDDDSKKLFDFSHAQFTPLNLWCVTNSPDRWIVDERNIKMCDLNLAERMYVMFISGNDLLISVTCEFTANKGEL